MIWLVDTQLPHQLATALKQRGHTALHASELPQGHRSSDTTIIEHSNRTVGIVVTKDADFLAMYQLKALPERMVYVSTGNIRNRELIFLFMRHLENMVRELEGGGLVELTREGLLVR